MIYISNQGPINTTLPLSPPSPPPSPPFPSLHPQTHTHKKKTPSSITQTQLMTIFPDSLLNHPCQQLPSPRFFPSLFFSLLFFLTTNYGLTICIRQLSYTAASSTSYFPTGLALKISLSLSLSLSFSLSLSLFLSLCGY